MPDKRVILLVQGNDADAEATRNAFENSSQHGFQVVWVQRRVDALQRIADAATRSNQRFAAILLDLFLSDSQGLETFERLFKAAPQIPILVLSAAQHEDLARQAVHLGAQDYLMQGRLDNYLLPKALTGMIDRAAIAEALFEEKERAQVTLNSIGDAVMSCDVAFRVTYMNKVAEHLTGWEGQSAIGRSIEEVFRVIDITTRDIVPNPMVAAILEDKTVMLAPNSVLSRRDGIEAAIEDSAAPIHDRHGQVTGAVMVFHDVSTTRALSLKMAHQSRHDALTDLPNRAQLDDRLTHAMVLARRHQRKLAVLYLDLDHFKNVNDSLGHDVGDQMLKLVAQRLLSCVRGSDTVCRLGGDEFVILLCELAHGRDAGISAEKIMLAINTPFSIGSHALHMTASIGVGIFPDDGDDAETLLKNADFAMYHAKECGRSNYQYFRDELNARALERQQVEADLHLALERNEFVLHYQPVVDLWNGAATGVEALIRWQHPRRGLLTPAEFVPIAEECGLIVAIGRWVLREACRQNRAWQEAGLPAIRVAINVSAVELRHRDFVACVKDTLAESGLAAQYLELELTETFLMQDSESTALVLLSLKDLGVQLALDDFGTGYSSLSHLKGFPIDTLKIDRTFVAELVSNTDDLSIVRAMIGLGESLLIRVVAEGVETAEQLTLLQEEKCPEGQGHFFGRPVVGAEFPALQSKIEAGMLKDEGPVISGPAAKRRKATHLNLVPTTAKQATAPD